MDIFNQIDTYFSEQSARLIALENAILSTRNISLVLLVVTVISLVCVIALSVQIAKIRNEIDELKK